EGIVLAGLAVDGHARVDVAAVLLAGGGRKRRFQRLEDHVLVHALLVGDGIDDQQYLFVHDSISSVSVRSFRNRAPGVLSRCRRPATGGARRPPRYSPRRPRTLSGCR